MNPTKRRQPKFDETQIHPFSRRQLAALLRAIRKLARAHDRPIRAAFDTWARIVELARYWHVTLTLKGVYSGRRAEVQYAILRKQAASGRLDWDALDYFDQWDLIYGGILAGVIRGGVASWEAQARSLRGRRLKQAVEALVSKDSVAYRRGRPKKEDRLWGYHLDLAKTFHQMTNTPVHRIAGGDWNSTSIKAEALMEFFQTALAPLTPHKTLGVHGIDQIVRNLQQWAKENPDAWSPAEPAFDPQIDEQMRVWLEGDE